jgi:phenylalanine ammonia-lyase
MFDELFKEFSESLGNGKSVYLTANRNLTIAEIARVAKNNAKLVFRIPKSHRDKFKLLRKYIIKQVRSGVPIYGTTTSYGGRASVVLNKGDERRRWENAKRLSEAIIHVDVSTGPAIKKEIVRGAMLIRINMLLSGHSGIRYKNLYTLKELLNKNITPVVGQFGTLGASGDLAQNGRVLSCMLHNDSVFVWDQNGKKRPARAVLEEENIKPITLLPKEGLSLVNGDNFSTSAGVLILHELVSLMLINTVTAALNIEALQGSTRNFHPLLSKLRPHPGQELESKLLRILLEGSKLALQELKGFQKRKSGVSVQDPYSIRCLPQYYGPDWEALIEIWNTLKRNANSVSDNPLWTTPEYTVEGEEPYQWVSGGNFLAMHVAEAIDRMRKIMVHIIKQNDRHIARLVHPEFNNGLPANLSDRNSVSQSTFKGLQTQMGMYEVYSMLLVNPVTTMFGIHEEFNQDITSHSFTSAILAHELLQITRLSLATGMMSACQAIDLRGGPKLLSPKTKPLYDWVRTEVPYIKKAQPLGHYVEKLSNVIGGSYSNITDLILKTVKLV